MPVIVMLSLTAEELEQRARSLADGLDVELIAGESALGGGAGHLDVSNHAHRDHASGEVRAGD